jgi:hypothetical protein
MDGDKCNAAAYLDPCLRRGDKGEGAWRTNKANSELSGRRPRPIVQNKPNSATGPARGIPIFTIPAFQSGTGCTNEPNWARGPAGSLGVDCTNEANLGRPSARRDASVNEQSQFRTAGRWRNTHHSIIPSFQRSSVPIRHRSCETKPIGGPGAAGQDIPLRQYAIIPILRSRACRAKQSQWLRSKLRRRTSEQSQSLEKGYLKNVKPGGIAKAFGRACPRAGGGWFCAQQIRHRQASKTSLDAATHLVCDFAFAPGGHPGGLSPGRPATIIAAAQDVQGAFCGLWVIECWSDVELQEH